MLVDDYAARVEHLLVDPDVPVLFEEHRLQSLLQEALEDLAVVFLAELLHRTNQFLVLERVLSLKFIKHELIKQVDAGAAVGLNVEGRATHSSD